MNLAVFFGGLSSEHDISCISAASVIRNLDKEKYNVLAVGITKQGEWFLYRNADADKIENGEWKNEKIEHVVLSPDRITHGLVVLHEVGIPEIIKIDCAFPVLHGAYGEDGTIQGLFELAGINYVGSGVAASANGMDKSITKIIVEAAGVKQADYYLATKVAFDRDDDKVAVDIEGKFGHYPVFVKPCSSGSSVGVTRANNREELKIGLVEAFEWDSKVLVEEFLNGQEIEVAVLGNANPVASTVGEIAPTQEFYTFDAKYNDDSSALYIPARISSMASETARENAIKIYRALGCTGLSRVDFFCVSNGDSEQVIFNEINTLPGFTSISMYPKLFNEDGISYSRLLDKLIELAQEKQ